MAGLFFNKSRSFDYCVKIYEKFVPQYVRPSYLDV